MNHLEVSNCKKQFKMYQSLLSRHEQNLLQKQETPKLDMHIHTTMSDGLFTIPQIIYMAKKIGLQRIFITDHNTILPGYQRLKTISKDFLGNLQVDIGCEIACKIEDPSTGKFIPIEVLSYFANPYKIQDFINNYQFSNLTSQQEQLEIFLTICESLHLKHSKKIELPAGAFATEILCKDLIQYEENKDYFMQKAPIVWNSPKLFYKKFVANPASDFYLDTTKGLPYYTDVIDAIIDNEGIPILSHPFIYIYKEEKDIETFLNQIYSNSNILGLEAIHSDHDTKQREFLKQFCRSHSLIYSGGTDFHSGPDTILGYGKKERPLCLQLEEFEWIHPSSWIY